MTEVRKNLPIVVSSAIAIIGGLCLVLSLFTASTVLAFIGLGLTFWGALLLFTRPKRYVRSDLVDSTVLSSLKTIDRVITSLGYEEKGIYIPARNATSKQELVLLVLGELSEKAGEIDTETLAIGCFERYPSEFGLIRFPDYPDLQSVHEALADLEKAKRVLPVGGKKDRRWMLTPNGVRWYEENKPGLNENKTILFIPSQRLSRIPKAAKIRGQTFIKHPSGIAVVPPGQGLANVIERELGVEFSKCSLQTLSEKLPKILIEDLEMVQDFEMQFVDNMARFRFVEPIYSHFCSRLSSNKVCSTLGCPICSAMACILAQATGRPVVMKKDEYYPESRTVEPTYRIVGGVA